MDVQVYSKIEYRFLLKCLIKEKGDYVTTFISFVLFYRIIFCGNLWNKNTNFLKTCMGTIFHSQKGFANFSIWKY